MFDYPVRCCYRPMCVTIPANKAEDVLRAMDTAIAPLREKPVDAQLLARSRVKLRSSMYDTMSAVRRLRPGEHAGQLCAVR